MLFSKIEYVLMRLVRRYLFTDKFLVKFGKWIPYYYENINQNNPQFLVDIYQSYVKEKNLTFDGKVVLELGSGVTNSVSYELLARGCSEVYLYEPFAEFNEKKDKELLLSIAEKYGLTADEILQKVNRCTELECIPDNKIDLVFSNSVLEHVLNPLELFRALYLKMNYRGMMFHLVDYRDHFFKYPYHKLLFTKAQWNKWLNPGDLPGWVLRDHIAMFENSGFSVHADMVEKDSAKFEKIRKIISNDYNKEDTMLQAMHCRLSVVKNEII